MSNAYVDMSAKIKKVVFHRENAEDIIQLVAMRIMKKLVDILQSSISVSARAALRASMGNFEIKSLWHKNGNIIYEGELVNDDLNSNTYKQSEDKHKTRITSM